jgi:predicted RNA polymerase sigma factor
MPSPIVELNRAVAVGMGFGPEAGLERGNQDNVQFVIATI